MPSGTITRGWEICMKHHGQLSNSEVRGFPIAHWMSSGISTYIRLQFRLSCGRLSSWILARTGNRARRWLQSSTNSSIAVLVVRLCFSVYRSNVCSEIVVTLVLFASLFQRENIPMLPFTPFPWKYLTWEYYDTDRSVDWTINIRNLSPEWKMRFSLKRWLPTVDENDESKRKEWLFACHVIWHLAICPTPPAHFIPIKAEDGSPVTLCGTH